MPNTDDIINQSLVLPPDGYCFHCGEPLPKTAFVAVVLGAKRDMCCMGCQLAAQSIVECGLEQYYLDRQEISKIALMPDELALDAYNHQDIQSEFVYHEQDTCVAQLSVVGLRCSACVWLIEKRLGDIQGVQRCSVNLTNQRMQVAWRDDVVDIATILKAVAKIGYDARPYRTDTHENALNKTNKTMLIRLFVAGIGAMQAMMFSVGLYFGFYSGMATEHREFLRMVSMIVSIPVVFYAGLPFFVSALSAIKHKQINMDVPVSIALIVTFFASSYATFIHAGETYFDSVAMFVFFLLAGRYVEHTARLKATRLASDLIVVRPNLVQKIGEDVAFADFVGQTTKHAFDDKLKVFLQNLPKTAPTDIYEVKKGDVIVVPAGGQILCDGVLLSDTAYVSQSLLTGESDLIAKTCGDDLLGGSFNDNAVLTMIATQDTKNSQMALMDKLINRAMSEKPKIAQDADKMARWFVARVLVLAVLVFVGWWFVNPAQAVWASVAVLVATCPCALSLATPIALTVGTNTLAHQKCLITRGHTLTALSDVDTVCLDKTGTLTTGTPSLVAIDNLCKMSDDVLIGICASLEIASTHPLAKSITNLAKNLHLSDVSNLQTHSGGGVSAVIEDKSYRLGHERFALKTDKTCLVNLEEFGANMAVVLSVLDDKRDEFVALCVLYFNDVLRDDSVQVVEFLQKNGITPLILTGDVSDSGKKLGEKLGITAHTALLPEDKVGIIKQLQAQGKTVLMVGDGVNDAPVLATATVSMAVANGSDLAQVSADAVILSDGLTPVISAIKVAKKTHAIIRQNLKWALFYNSAILLPAGFGYVPPWLAAIGMSLSSLLVVTNATRIGRYNAKTKLGDTKG